MFWWYRSFIKNVEIYFEENTCPTYQQKSNIIKLMNVLVSYCRYNKLPQIEQFKNNTNYYPTALEDEV